MVNTVYCVLPKLDGIRMDLLGSHFDEKGEKRKKAHAFICKNSCPEIYFWIAYRNVTRHNQKDIHI